MKSEKSYSNHALKRIQQRGIPRELVDIILQYGTPVRQPGGVYEIFIKKKDKNKIISAVKRIIQALDKAGGKAVLISSDTNQIITVYHCCPVKI